LPLSERIAHADAFMAGTGATVQHGGISAFYAPSRDLIQLPPFEAFKDKESCYRSSPRVRGGSLSRSALLPRSFDARDAG